MDKALCVVFGRIRWNSTGGFCQIHMCVTAGIRRHQRRILTQSAATPTSIEFQSRWQSPFRAQVSSTTAPILPCRRPTRLAITTSFGAERVEETYAVAPVQSRVEVELFSKVTVANSSTKPSISGLLLYVACSTFKSSLSWLGWCVFSVKGHLSRKSPLRRYS